MTDVDDARFKFLVLSLINDTIARGTSQLGRLEPPEMEAISLMKKYQVERMVIGPHEVRLATRSQVCAGVETPLESRLRFQKLSHFVNSKFFTLPKKHRHVTSNAHASHRLPHGPTLDTAH